MKKLLLVDDDKDLSRIYEFELKKRGYEVHTAEDGNVGYENIKNDKWDLVLLDVQMPGMTGIDLLKKLQKEKDDFLSTTPCFLLTNLGQDEVVEMSKNLGVRDVLIKALYTPKQIGDIVDLSLKVSKETT